MPDIDIHDWLQAMDVKVPIAEVNTSDVISISVSTWSQPIYQ